MIRLIVVDPARGDISLYLSKEVKRTMPLRKYNALSSFIKILMSDQPTLSSTWALTKSGAGRVGRLTNDVRRDGWNLQPRRRRGGRGRRRFFGQKRPFS